MSDKFKRAQTLDLQKPSLAKKREIISSVIKNPFEKKDSFELNNSYSSNTPIAKDVMTPNGNYNLTGSYPFTPTNRDSSILQTPTASNNSGNVKVVCRVRPLNSKEQEFGGICVEMPDFKTIIIKNNTQNNDVMPGSHKFIFDRVFDYDASQEEVYNFTAKPVVDSVLEGFNGTVFAYGQTGSGKTFTMQGPDIDDPYKRGIIPRMVDTVFEHITMTPEHIEFTVKCAMVEIYMEKIRDLLNPDKTHIKIREDKVRGVYLEDVTELYVSQDQDVYDLMVQGNSHRAMAATNMNEGSSRSHMLFMMSIHQNNLHDLSAKTGKLYLVDLAGSEKIAKTGAEGKTLEEAKKINKSLSSLGNVINALTDGKSHFHIPYRDSKLTRVLQESLGGNSRTTLIITCSPSVFNDAETLSTLRFGYRAKSIKNTPKINREYTVAELQLLLEKAERENEKLKKRVKQLEQLLKDKDIQLPPEDEETLSKVIEDTKEDRDSEEESVEDSSVDNQDDTLMKKPVPVSNYSMLTASENLELKEKITQLEIELEGEKTNVKTQTEKISLLRKEFAHTNAKVITTQKENEALIHKLATLTLKMQEYEAAQQERDLKIQGIESLRDTLMAENEELKNSKEHLLNLLQEREEELQQVSQSNKFSTPNRRVIDLVSLSSEKSSSSPPTENLSQDIYKELTEKIGMKDKELAKKISQSLSIKFKPVEPLNNSPPKVSMLSNESVKKLQEELMEEREKNNRFKKDFEKLSKEYDTAVKKTTPDYEELKTQILNKEKQKFEREKKTLVNDLQTRIDRVVKLEMELEEEREKNRILETSMTESEKTLKKKVNVLEANLESVTKMYQLLSSQKSFNHVESQVNEKKLQRKTERITNLEKQLSETKELVIMNQKLLNMIESLKALITVSGNNNIPVSQMLEGEDIQSLDLLDSGEFGQPESPPTAKKNTNAKIVKHIRGGQTGKKSNSGSNSKMLAMALKQSGLTNSNTKNDDSDSEVKRSD